MVYVTYNKETGAVDDTAYSRLNMIPEGVAYLAVPEEDWRNAHGKIKTVEDGLFVYREPEKSLEEIIRSYENAVQAHLDATAQNRDYDNTYTCLSYLSSTDETWNREANIFNAWRDAVWRKCHEVLNAVMAGTLTPPSIEELIAQLPKIEW